MGSVSGTEGAGGSVPGTEGNVGSIPGTEGNVGSIPGTEGNVGSVPGTEGNVSGGAVGVGTVVGIGGKVMPLGSVICSWVPGFVVTPGLVVELPSGSVNSEYRFSKSCLRWLEISR